ncbi:MAG: hypothetical protein AAFY38_07330 [Pseudomonadota bacterium]
MRIKNWTAAAVAALGLAACGATPNEQAVAGGAAGLGAAVLTDGNLLTGAAIGAAGNLLYCQNNPGRCD